MSQDFPFRQRDYACAHPETYKYYFAPERVEEIWQRLEQRYGAIQENPAFGIQEIRTPSLWLRSTSRGNPITVIRRRKCQVQDIEALHELVEFSP